MDQDTLSRLFTPFEQADSSISRRFGGTGLGLFISQQLIQMMGGEIRVYSQKGKGSTFTVDLPLKASEIQIEQVNSVTEQTAIPQLQGRVLLAEDTLQLQKLVTVLLEKSGVTVEVANNGVEALQFGQQRAYQLILMDMQMPEMDGIEATRLLRKAGVETPIVALTANVMQHHKEMFERAGCDGFLSKPVKRSLLYQLLQRHLQPATEMLNEQRETFNVEAEPDQDEDLTELFDEEMMAEFWDYIAQARAELESAWEQGEWEQLRKTAHAVKGMGSSYGQPEMTQHAAKLQDIALSGDRALIESPLKQLITACTVS